MTDLASTYRLQRALSWTSAARTFTGQDPETGERLAVKVVSLAGEPQRDALTGRFKATASVLQSLAHPTLPDVVAYGVSDSGEAYLATRWFPGAPLSELALEPGDVLAVTMQVVEALESLSLHGLVHLGIGPENILVLPDHQAQLTGWGSSLLNVDWQSGQRAILGVSNAYSAPELTKAGSTADALWRADLYSVAAMTAELLGAEVSTADNGVQVKFAGELSKKLSRPEALRATLETSLAGDPDRRPDSYSALSKALQHAMPRERRSDPTATQPMPRLRIQNPSVDADGADSVIDKTDVVIDKTEVIGVASAVAAAKLAESTLAKTKVSSAPLAGLPDLPEPPIEPTQVISAPGVVGSALPAVEAPTASKPVRAGETDAGPESNTDRELESVDADRGDTGVHAIRQETGSFVLPKSSSEEGQGAASPMFEADELGRMIDDLAEEELLDGERAVVPAQAPLTTESTVRADDRTVLVGRPGHSERESTTAEIELPSQALVDGDSVSDDLEGRREFDTPPEPVLVTRKGKLTVPRQPLNPELAKGSDVPLEVAAAGTKAEAQSVLSHEETGQQPVASDPAAATRWVSPADVSEMVAKATQQQEGAEPNDVRSEFGGESETDKPTTLGTPSPQGLEDLEDGDAKTVHVSPSQKAEPLVSTPATSPSAEPRGAPEAATQMFKTAAQAVDSGDSKGETNQAPPPVGVASGKSLPSSKKLWIGLAAAALVMVLLGGTLVAALLRREADPTPETVTKPATVDPEAPAPQPKPELAPLSEELERLVILVAEGTWQEAVPLATALEARAQAGDLSAEDGSVLLDARAALDLGYGAELVERLGPALERLDVNEMRDTLRGGATAMAVLRKQPGGGELATRARRVLRSVDAFRSALDRGEGTEPLDRAQDLARGYPALAERFDAVNRATARVEQVALELEEEGRLGEAASLVAEASSKTELTPELEDLRTRISERLQRQEAKAELLRTAEAFGRDGEPHRGLDLLGQSSFVGEERRRASEVRRQLESELARLDSEPPTVDLMGESIDLKRGEPLNIDLVIVDDYETTEVLFEVVADGRAAQRLPVRAESERNYSVQIPANLHQGKPLRFWVTALDRSGHQGTLGSIDEPIEVRRKRWYKVFRRRGGPDG